LIHTPVAFIIFNRPDLTQIVFNAIRQAQPKQLFVIADGPRFTEETEKCQQARDIIKQVDWDCEIFTNYAETNLGCRQRVSSGITWVFEQVEEAIILEDDCLPTASFFSFCQNLLEYYRNDTRIMVISGNNFQDGNSRTDYSYYFSRYNHCWGWASWRRAWQYWDFKTEKWLEFRNSQLIKYIFDDHYEEQYWTNIFDKVFLEGKPNSWAYMWTFACWSQSGLTILPNHNLVSNIGFREDATHTTATDSKVSRLPTVDIWQIKHPPFVVRNRDADTYTFDNIFGGLQMKKADSLSYKLRSNISRIKQRLIRLLTDPTGVYNSLNQKLKPKI
jgi:hypothetical protein